MSSPGVWDKLGEVMASLPVHFYIEAVLVLFIIYIVWVKEPYNPSKRGYGHRNPDELTEEEIDEQVDWWKPEPLVPPSNTSSDGTEPTVDSAGSSVVISSQQGKHVTLEGQPDSRLLLNAASSNFLGLNASDPVKKAALATLDEYTCGSCGPRGFYGTTQKHLQIEAAIADFLGVDESICYSDAMATLSSSLPAFAKRKDLIVMDDGCQAALVTGAKLSRSKLLTFKHNDMDDLRRVLQSVKDKDRKYGDQSATQRRLIVVEAVYRHDGSVAPLKQIVALKHEFKFRVILDESLSIGVLGATGRGLTEEVGVPVHDVDLVLGSLSSALGSVGGFCAGSHQVVDHQRLSGAGYCFSASAPPFTCTVATAALEQLQKRPQVVVHLRHIASRLHAELSRVRGITVVSDPASPVAHFTLNAVSADLPRDRQVAALDNTIAALLEHDVVASRPFDSSTWSSALQPTITLASSALFNDGDVEKLVGAVRAVVGSGSAGAGAGSGSGSTDSGVSSGPTLRPRRRNNNKKK